MITGKDYVFTQSDAIEQMLTMKVTFKEAARGGERRIRVRLRDEERGFWRLSRFLERIQMEHIESIYSSKS